MSDFDQTALKDFSSQDFGIYIGSLGLNDLKDLQARRTLELAAVTAEIKKRGAEIKLPPENLEVLLKTPLRKAGFSARALGAFSLHQLHNIADLVVFSMPLEPQWPTRRDSLAMYQRFGSKTIHEVTSKLDSLGLSEDLKIDDDLLRSAVASPRLK